MKENIFFEESVNDAGGLMTLVTTSSSYAFEDNGDIVVTSRKEIDFIDLKIQQVRKLFFTDGKYYKVLLGFFTYK